MCVSGYWSKKSVRFNNLLKLYSKLSGNISLVAVGKLTDGARFPDSIIHIPYVNDIHELVKIYSSADVYVHLSVEDTFGKVVAEAMACGTPVIVFNTTALPELVKKNCGYVVEINNINEIINKIEEIFQHKKNYYSDDCIMNVTNRFDKTTILNELVELYEKSLT